MSTLKTSQQPDPNDIRTELDNHADTSVVSPAAALILTEVCHFGHFWLSYGRCAMSGSPMARSEAAP